MSSEGTKEAEADGGTPAANFLDLGPGAALGGFGGLRLVEEVGRVLAAGLAAIDAETIMFWVVLDSAGFCSSATSGLAKGRECAADF